MTDSQAILQHLDLQHLLQGYDKNVHLRDEIAIMTGFNFALLDSLPSACASPRDLARRLWAAFQLNGLLSPFRNASALEGLADRLLTREAFTRLVYREQERHWQELRLAGGFAKRRTMAEGYGALPPGLLERFLRVYARDFDYFGYDRRPGDIFV